MFKVGDRVKFIGDVEYIVYRVNENREFLDVETPDGYIIFIDKKDLEISKS